MHPISKHGDRIAFVNFIQSLTFLAADLQSRLACGVFSGRIMRPPLEEQRAYMHRLRNAMSVQHMWLLSVRCAPSRVPLSPPSLRRCVQHMDRQQLRVQYGK